MFRKIYEKLLEAVAKGCDKLNVTEVSALSLSDLSCHYGEAKLVSVISDTSNELGIKEPTSVYSDWDNIDLEYVAEVLADCSENVTPEEEPLDLTPPIDICCMLGKCWIGECR